MAFNFVGTSKLSYGSYILPDWAQTIGWLVAVIPVVLVPVYAVLVYIYDRMCNAESGETVLQVGQLFCRKNCGVYFTVT